VARHTWILACALLGACEQEPFRLCDGSDSIQLLYHVKGGGAVPLTTEFTNPTGWELLAIDGKCHYYASNNYLRGYVTGTLTDGEAQQLEHELHFVEIDYWVTRFKSGPASCVDGATASLHASSGSLSCTCSCPSDAPIGLGEVLGTNGEAALERLMAAGESLSGPVSAAITPDPTQGAGAQGPAVAWPLDRAIDDVAELVFTSTNDERLRTGPYASFESDDAAALRALRSEQHEKSPDNHFVYVPLRDRDKSFSLYVRDEWPEDFVERMESFRPDLFD
jgi:hypothetical protein